jgi:general secretion pathway protein G
MYRTRRMKKGFTLIELLVVISIIGMLTILIIANFNAARERARDVQRKSDLSQLKRILRMYYNDQDPTAYPVNSADYEIMGCGDPPTTFSWGSQFACGSMLYAKILPSDPLYKGNEGDPQYSYVRSTDTHDFCLWATLENESDSDIDKTKNRCATACTDASVSFTGDDYVYVVCAD